MTSAELAQTTIIVPNQVVRHAVESDLPRLVELMRQFGASRSFREPFTQDRSVMSELLMSCLNPAHGTVLVLVEDRAVVGLIVMCLMDHPLSRERIASELAWFVDPENRGGGHRLLLAVEAWARECGVTRLSLVAPSERIGRIYERWGFSPMEATYSKALDRRSLASVPRRGIEGVTLIPLQPEDWAQVWTWINEDRRANCDDTGPQTCEAFVEDGQRRVQDGRRAWIVRFQDVPCGFVSWVPVTPRLGMFQGICFARDVLGMGIATTAVRRVLEDAFAEGIQKMSATYFATNQRVRHFLSGCGAIDEGFLSRHTTQNGQSVDVRVVAIFAPERKDL